MGDRIVTVEEYVNGRFVKVPEACANCACEYQGEECKTKHRRGECSVIWDSKPDSDR